MMIGDPYDTTYNGGYTADPAAPAPTPDPTGDLKNDQVNTALPAGLTREQILQVWNDVTGGKYTPTEQQINDALAQNNTVPLTLAQLKQGASTWWANNQPKTTTTTTPPPTVTSGGFGPATPDSGFKTTPPGVDDYFTQRYQAPTPTPLPDVPVFNAPVYTPPPAFSYQDFSYAPFVAPDATTMYQDPGYRFRTDEGRHALEASAAGRGVLNTGGTLTDLLRYGQDMASQEYKNVWDRSVQDYTMKRNNAFDNYATNRANALGIYNTNYQTQYQDPYAANYKAAQDMFAPKMTAYKDQAANTQHLNDVANSNAWNQYTQDYTNFTGYQRDWWNRRYQTATAS